MFFIDPFSLVNFLNLVPVILLSSFYTLAVLLHIYKFQLLKIVVTYTTVLLISTFNHSMSGVLFFPDLGARLNINENVLNSYFFFWTNITYLPSFFFAVSFIVAFVLLVKWRTGQLLVAYLLFLFYNIEFVDFQSANQFLAVFDTTQTSFNFLLTNNLNKYHPMVFYLSAILCFLNIFLIQQPGFKDIRFAYPAHLIRISKVSLSTVWINLFALYMGSWWALQEGTWGGWWNWDASEVFGLLFAVLILRFLHTSVSIRYYFEIYLWVRVMSVSLVLVYFFIQLNFDLVSHNFGSKFFFFFSNNLFFIEIITLGIAFNYILTRVTADLYNQYTLLCFVSSRAPRSKSSTHVWPILFFYGVTFVLMFNSFLPLLNYFWWNFFKVNLFNVEIYTKKWLVVIIFSLVFVAPFYNTSTPTVSYLYLTDTTLLLLAAIIQNSRGYIQWLHLLLLSFFIINLISHDTSFIYFYTLDARESFFFNNQLYYLAPTLLTCDNFEIATSFNYLTPRNGLWFSNYNLIYHSNTPLINSFTLLMTPETALNIYHLTKDSLVTILYIETPLLPFLNLYALSGFLVFYFLIFTR